MWAEIILWCRAKTLVLAYSFNQQISIKLKSTWTTRVNVRKSKDQLELWWHGLQSRIYVRRFYKSWNQSIKKGSCFSTQKLKHRPRYKVPAVWLAHIIAQYLYTCLVCNLTITIPLIVYLSILYSCKCERQIYKTWISLCSTMFVFNNWTANFRDFGKSAIQVKDFS